jgi:hypothetical protein
MRKVDLNSTLEQIDNDVWPDPDNFPGLVTTVHRLRKKPLNEFTTADLRVMIGQNMNPEQLIPLAIEFLKKEPLLEGDCYPGDLLINVMRSDKAYWQKNRNNWAIVMKLVGDLLSAIESDKEYRQVVRNFESFRQIITE